jgi:hypothetical protein
VAVGVLLGCAAFIVGYESKSLLIGESASADVSASIVSALESGPEGFRMIHLRTSHVSPESLLVTGKIAVSPTMRAADLAAGIDAAEARIRGTVPIAETIYLEPDIYRPGQENRADPSVEVVRRSRGLRSRLPRRSSTQSTSARASTPPPQPGTPAPPPQPDIPAPSPQPNTPAPSRQSASRPGSSAPGPSSPAG